MFIYEFFKVIFGIMMFFGAVTGTVVLSLAFLGDMEIVYKAKILDTEISRTTKVLDRIAWGINGLMAVFKILIDRQRLHRLVMLVEAIPTHGDRPPNDFEEKQYQASSIHYSPMEGSVLVFYATEEDQGEPLYVLRPYQFLAEDWKTAMGGGV